MTIKAGFIKPRVYIKKMPNLEVKDSFINMEQIGAMLEGNMGRMGVNITGIVLTAMNKQIEDKRIRKNPIGKHNTSLEPWRLTAGRNLIAVLRESTEIRKEEFGNTFRYTFILGQRTFLDKHTGGKGSGQGKGVGYWAMLNYGGKISIDATGVPGYFGAGQRPSSLHNDQPFHWTGRKTFIKKQKGGPALSPVGIRIGLMIPKKLINGINYIGAGYQAYLKHGKSSIKEMVSTLKEELLSKATGGRLTKEKRIKAQAKLKAFQDAKAKLVEPETAKTLEQKARDAGFASVAQYLMAKQRGLA